ncbi:hypothetical protein Ddc_15135 [Ditylenchus destructor]|nr:hypothetical protein Ddc_15135 [Ditylenchus destructor]
MEFICYKCPTILKDEQRRPHISAVHLKYYKFGCAICEDSNNMFWAASKEQMTQHTDFQHNGNSRILLLEDPAKEETLHQLVEQCIRLPIQRDAEATQIEPPTTTQITPNVAADSTIKLTIKKFFVVISEGIVCFETSDHRKFDYAPLSEYAEILRDGVLDEDHEIALQFYGSDEFVPYQYRKSCTLPVNEINSLDQLQSFAEQCRSVSKLWSDARITAQFGRYKKKSNNTPSQSDYCTLLFGAESIFKCRQLFLEMHDNWPIQIINHAIDVCNCCELHLVEASQGNRDLHSKFLDFIFESEVHEKLQEMSLSIYIQVSAENFAAQLKEVTTI